jgi:hypothetical protein
VRYPLRNQPKITSRNFTNQRLILIRSRNNNWQKDVKVTRDRLNKELQAKLNSQQPIIASITKASYSENVILVATLRFTAQDLLSHKEIIQSTFKCERMQKDVQWFKTMVHGIAISDFNTVTGMAELQKDIEMFNPKLRLATLPR